MSMPHRLLIQGLAINHRVDPLLLSAMIRVESGNRPWAFRYESHAGKYLVSAEDTAKLCGISVDTEKMAQMTSWGLMQVMGFSARELGFKGLLTELCEPELGITYGIYKLKQLEKRFLSKVSVSLGYDEALIAAYNAGSPRKKADGSWENQGYVDKVERAYEHLQTKGIK
jgi:hypothetical protein